MGWRRTQLPHMLDAAQRAAARTVLFLTVHVLFVAVGLLGVGVKIGTMLPGAAAAVRTTPGAFASRYTNWNWVLVTAYYAAAYITQMFDARADALLMVWAFPAVCASTVAVGALAPLLIYLAPELVEDAGVPLGAAVLLEKVFHTLPLAWLAVYVGVRWHALRAAFTREAHAPRAALVRVLWLALVPLAAPLIYVIAVDTAKVYSVPTPHALNALAMLCVAATAVFMLVFIVVGIDAPAQL